VENLPTPALKKSSAQQLPRKNASHPVRLSRDSVEGLDKLLDAAYQAYQNSNFALAEQHYQQALSIAPDNIDTLLGLAALAQYRGDDEQTARYFSNVLRLDPRNALALAGMSALGVDDNRESQLKRLLLAQNNSAPLHFSLGNYYAAQARWSEAQLAYFNAYQLDPDQPLLALNLAVSLEHLGLTKLAAQYYRRAVQTDTSKRADFNHAAIEQHAQQLIAKNAQ
jgi:cytochrome c-type biogenesis protein CcmH/NrfG